MGTGVGDLLVGLALDHGAGGFQPIISHACLCFLFFPSSGALDSEVAVLAELVVMFELKFRRLCSDVLVLLLVAAYPERGLPHTRGP